MDTSVVTTLVAMRSPLTYGGVQMSTLTPERPGDSRSLTVRLPDELMRSAREAAEAEERTLAGIVRRALTRYIATETEPRRAA